MNTRVRCSIGGLCVNVLAYADDLVLCVPSWVGLQHLIDVLANRVNTICMFCNVITRNSSGDEIAKRDLII